MRLFFAAFSILLLLSQYGECDITCYECESESGWRDCDKHWTKKYCASEHGEPWSCVRMKEKPEGRKKYYFRRTCSEASVCDEFCRKKKNCVYECCDSELCNNDIL